MHSLAVSAASPGGAATVQVLELQLAEARADLVELKGERDELEARLLSALEELGELRGRVAALAKLDSDIVSEDETDHPALRPAAPPPLPPPSRQSAPAPAPALEVYTVSGMPPPGSLAPAARIASGAPPPAITLAPAAVVASTAPPAITLAPSRSTASADLSRLVVSTHPPARESSPPSSPDRRSIERRPCEFEIEFLGDSHFTTGLTQDLSEGGVFVATYQSLPIGTPVSLAFELPSGHRVEARGEVRWVRGEREDTDSRPGLGIAFTELGAEALAKIVEYCGSSPAHYYEF